MVRFLQKTRTLRGFTSAAVAPLECDNTRKRNTTPEKALQCLDRIIQLLKRYYNIIPLSAGAVRGDRHGPLFIL